MITYEQVCDQVANALRQTAGVKKVESYKEISESITVEPTLHIYPTGAEVSDDEDTDRLGFGSGAPRVTVVTMKIDGYARAASHIRHDIQAQIKLADAIDNVLSAQITPLYGATSIQAHRWTWERGILRYAEKDYAGVTFTLRLTIF